jgi:hypothetical protein
MNAEGLSGQIEWWDALDAIVGFDSTAEGVVLARKCRHSDAQWFFQVVPQDEEADVLAFLKRGLIEACPDDPRAMFIHGALANRQLVAKAAELGYAPAQALMASIPGCRREQFAWAENALAQNDRNGMYHAACRLQEGRGCTPNLERAAALFERASELGHAVAPLRLGTGFYGAYDWRRYRLWGLALERDSPWAAGALMEAAAEHAGEAGRVVFEIGGALRRAEKRPKGRRELHLTAHALRCVEVYNLATARAEAAIECWLAVGQRLGVVKDMRRLIAQMVWEDRGAWSGTHGEDLRK